MTEVATNLNIQSEAELFDMLTKNGISTITLWFSYDGHGFRDWEDAHFEYNDQNKCSEEEGDILDVVQGFGSERADALMEGADGEGFHRWQKYGDVGESYFMGVYDDDGYPSITFDVSNRKVSLDGDIQVKKIVAEHVSRTWNPDEE